MAKAVHGFTRPTLADYSLPFSRQSIVWCVSPEPHRQYGGHAARLYDTCLPPQEGRLQCPSAAFVRGSYNCGHCLRKSPKRLARSTNLMKCPYEEGNYHTVPQIFSLNPYALYHTRALDKVTLNPKRLFYPKRVGGSFLYAEALASTPQCRGRSATRPILAWPEWV